MSSVAGYTVYNTQKTPSLIFDASICSVIYFFNYLYPNFCRNRIGLINGFKHPYRCVVVIYKFNPTNFLHIYNKKIKEKNISVLFPCKSDRELLQQQLPPLVSAYYSYKLLRSHIFDSGWLESLKNTTSSMLISTSHS